MVLAEIAWVLRVAYKFDRSTTAATLRGLIDIDGVHARTKPRRALRSPLLKLVLQIFPTISSWNLHGANPRSHFTLSMNA